MIDREKVIKGLEHCLSRYVDGFCDDCSYMGKLDKSYAVPMKCKELMMRDVLALLKEQEAVEPIEVFKKDTNCHEYHCKRCGNKVGTILGGKHPILPGVKLSIEHFCDVCGQAVKWE